MVVEETDKQVIEHIVQYCKDINKATEVFGNGIKIFSENPVYRHACTMCILLIGEMSNRLSDDFKEQYKEIFWGSIKGMRNIAAHNYGKIDIEVTWEIISYDIPNLRKFCDEVFQTRGKNNLE